MADQKITALTENTTPILTDIIPMVDDPAGTPATQKVKISSLATILLTANIYRARAYRNGSQSISGSGFTKMQLNAESYDSNNNFDSATNYRYTAPVAGYYQVCGNISVQSSTVRLVVVLYKNGAEVSRGFDYTSGSSIDFGGSFSDIIQLAATDYLELYGYFSGAATVVGSTVGQTFLSVHLIST